MKARKRHVGGELWLRLKYPDRSCLASNDLDLVACDFFDQLVNETIRRQHSHDLSL